MTLKGYKKQAQVAMFNWLSDKNDSYVSSSAEYLQRKHPGEHVFVIRGVVVTGKKLGPDTKAEIDDVRAGLRAEMQKRLSNNEELAKMADALFDQYARDHDFAPDCTGVRRRGMGKSEKVAATFREFSAAELSDILVNSMLVHKVEVAANRELIRLEQPEHELRKGQ